jgi:hypothetical protein
MKKIMQSNAPTEIMIMGIGTMIKQAKAAAANERLEISASLKDSGQPAYGSFPASASPPQRSVFPTPPTFV